MRLKPGAVVISKNGVLWELRERRSVLGRNLWVGIAVESEGTYCGSSNKEALLYSLPEVSISHILWGKEDGGTDEVQTAVREGGIKDGVPDGR